MTKKKWAAVPTNKVRVGTVLKCDGGFTCIPNGALRTVFHYRGDLEGWCHRRGVVDYRNAPRNSRSRLYIRCKHGIHFLDGQLDDLGVYGATGTHYVGFWIARQPKTAKSRKAV
jgi:hypothetical protein